MLLVAFLVAASGSPSRDADSVGAVVDRRPNVVVLMTDDQTVADLDVMPHVQALLAEAGVTFERS
jgi:arylsulfatase A-like enzyme